MSGVDGIIIDTSGSRPSARENKSCNGGVVFRDPVSPGFQMQRPWSKGRNSPKADNVFLIQRLSANFLMKLFWKFRLHGELVSASAGANNGVWGKLQQSTVPLFIYFYSRPRSMATER